MFTLDDIADEFSISLPELPLKPAPKTCALDLALAAGIDAERVTFGRIDGAQPFAEVRGDVNIVEAARACAWADGPCRCEQHVMQPAEEASRVRGGLFLNGRWVDPGEAAVVAKALRAGCFGEVPERLR